MLYKIFIFKILIIGVEFCMGFYEIINSYHDNIVHY